MMKRAGINVEKYGPYTTRSASVSKAAAISISMEQIMKTAGWTRETTFEKFYHKELVADMAYEDRLLDVSSRNKLK